MGSARGPCISSMRDVGCFLRPLETYFFQVVLGDAFSGLVVPFICLLGALGGSSLRFRMHVGSFLVSLLMCLYKSSQRQTAGKSG